MDDEGIFRCNTNLLEEAAKLDGAGRFRIFATVILPLTMPGLVATGIFSFINGSFNLLFASTFMKSYENWTAQSELQASQDNMRRTGEH